MSTRLSILGVLGLILASSEGIHAQPISAIASAPPETQALADDAILGSLRAELGRDHHIVATGISSSVTLGVAQLGGTVQLQLWRTRAERIARAVRGVRAVVNRIQVVPVLRGDREVERDVRAALGVTASLQQMPIRASVSNGVVELNGQITSWEEQELAERVACSVPGVRFCQNQLVTRRMVRSDAVLARDIRSAYDWDPLIEQDPIRIDVSNNRVILNGKVGSLAEASRAVRLAWVKDVIAVDGTKLQVTSPHPDPNVRARWPSESEMVTTAAELSRYWPDVPLANVSIAVLNGTATLRGTVETPRQSDAAAALVRALVGVVRVDNHLRGPWWRAPSAAAPPRRRRPR